MQLLSFSILVYVPQFRKKSEKALILFEKRSDKNTRKTVKINNTCLKMLKAISKSFIQGTY